MRDSSGGSPPSTRRVGLAGLLGGVVGVTYGAAGLLHVVRRELAGGDHMAVLV